MSSLRFEGFYEIDNDEEYREIPVIIEYDFQPAEACVPYYPDGTGYPGCPAEIDVTWVWDPAKKKEVDFSNNKELQEHFEQLCWDNVETLEDY